MDVMSMLTNATVKSFDGTDLGEVMGVHIVMGKMYLTVDIALGDGQDDGEKEDIPEDDASKAGFPRIVARGERAGDPDG